MPLPYDRLLRFPLFYGLGSGDLIQIVGRTKFDFRKHSEGDVLARQGEPCRHLHLLASGSLLMNTVSTDGQYSVDEEVSAPDTLQLECVYGLAQRYRSTFTARTEASSIVMEKRELTRLCDEYAVIRTNLVNLLAALAQKQMALAWREPVRSLQGRLIRFLADRCQQPRGSKTFHLLMQRLADEMGTDRRAISAALHGLETAGLLQLRRGCIKTAAMEELLHSPMAAV